MINVLGAVAGGVITLAGVALIWTPIPVGLLLIVIGVSMLATFSPTAREWIREFRGRHRGLDAKARDVEERLPEAARRAWRQTDPRH